MDAKTIWNEALTELKGSVTKGTFVQWVAGARGIDLRGDELVVVAPGPLAKEWLESRLASTVERAVAGVAGQHLRITYVLAPALNSPAGDLVGDKGTFDLPGQLDVQGEYTDRRNEIIHPDVIAPVTRYFRTKWVPLLGPVLSWVIVDLRQRAYWNRRTGERRDSFHCTLDEIAFNLGVSEDTVSRSLKRRCKGCNREHDVADHFVLRREPVYVERSDGKRVCIGTSFRVRLDEPLTPDDEQKLIETPDPQTAV